MVDIPQAHARLLADPTIQFRFPAAPPPVPPHPPALPSGAPWFEGGWLAWVVAAVAVAVLLAVVVQAVRGRGGAGRRKPSGAAAAQTGAVPPLLPALPASALADADALAGAGEYAAAVHALLLRGVDAIQLRFPRALVPSHTSRDIAVLAVLPPFMRDAFSTIAARTERAVFARAPLDQADWEHCRAVYASLLPSPDGVPP